MGNGLTFTIRGAARTKKNSPIPTPAKTKDGRSFTRILPSAASREWFKLAMSQLPVIRAGLLRTGAELPVTSLVNCQAIFYRDRDAGDLLGYEEALADWLQAPKIRGGKMVRQGAGIIVDDRQIVQWDGSRLYKDAADPRIEVTLTVIKEIPVSREMF